MGAVERHQEVIMIGSTETGSGVTLSHVVPPFHSNRERERDSGCVQYSEGAGGETEHQIDPPL